MACFFYTEPENTVRCVFKSYKLLENRANYELFDSGSTITIDCKMAYVSGLCHGKIVILQTKKTIRINTYTHKKVVLLFQNLFRLLNKQLTHKDYRPLSYPHNDGLH